MLSLYDFNMKSEPSAFSSLSEVYKFVVPRELSRANSRKNVRAVAWQQRNKASMTSDKTIEHGKQRR